MRFEAMSRPPPFLTFSFSKIKPYVFSVCDFCLCSSIYNGHRLHKTVLHVLKPSCLPLPLMTSNRCPVEHFGRVQNGPTLYRQNTIFAALNTLDEIASGRLNPNIWNHKGINKHNKQLFFSSYTEI